MRAFRIAGRLLLWGFAAIGLAATFLALCSIDVDSGCGGCTAARAQIASLEAVLELYKMDNGAYPTTEQGLAALAALPEVEPIPFNYPACGYLKSTRVPLDPWGSPFQYGSPGVKNPETFDLWSLGADGAPGGEGPDADITNWEAESPR